MKKSKDKPKEQQGQQSPPFKSSQCFVPFEGTGGGHQVNSPLSMHSEMMAIHSALSSSSTMSHTTASYEKPSFKLPGSSKRKARLRRELLTAYVNTVCQTSQRSGLSQVQECGFEASASGSACPPPRPQQQQGQGGTGGQQGGRGRAGASIGGQVERCESGVSRISGWSETSSEEERREEWSEPERVSVRGVRPVRTTDTTTFVASSICV